MSLPCDCCGKRVWVSGSCGCTCNHEICLEIIKTMEQSALRWKQIEQLAKDPKYSDEFIGTIVREKGLSLLLE